VFRENDFPRKHAKNIIPGTTPRMFASSQNPPIPMVNMNTVVPTDKAFGKAEHRKSAVQSPIFRRQKELDLWRCGQVPFVGV
jgi:hypothetical protein